MSWRRWMTPDRVLLLGLVLTVGVYARDLEYDFVLDDVPLILFNDLISSWHNWARVFTTHVASAQAAIELIPGNTAVHYRPVYVLWLMANHSLFGGVVPWWHLTSLLLHLLVIFLVYRLAERMLQNPWAAVLAALLFAFHPIHVESVTYVSASTDLLVTLFVLVSVFGYMRFREESGSPSHLIASVLAAALAMLSKESAAMLPWMLVAYEALRKRPDDPSPFWKRFVWTLPYFGIVLAYATVRTLLFGSRVGPAFVNHRFSVLANAPLLLLAYVRNLLWPIHLS